MTEIDRLDRELAAWFGETAAPRVPDYVDDILRETAPVRQRPRWTFPTRWLPMSVITFAGRTRRPIPWRSIGLIAALALLLVLAVAVLVGSQRRLPPPFGLAANGSIAFVQTPSGYENQTGYHEPFGDIVSVDPATGRVTTIVGGPDDDGVPVYSLDGARLSFVRHVEGGVALHVVDARGGSPLRLTGPLATIREVTWAPDGRAVAFTVAHDGRSDLWVAATDGSGARRLALDISGIAPQWRPPDGRELVFVGSADPGLDELGAYHGMFGYEDATGLAVYRIRLDTNELTLVGRPGGVRFDYGSTSWTPDGTRIVTQVQDANGDLHILVLDPTGREVSRISADRIGDSALAASVSPDGGRIAYAVIAFDGAWRVHVRPLDGIGPDVTTDHEFEGFAASLRWSPDGELVVVNHHYYPGSWLIDPDGGPARQAGWTDPGYSAWQRLAR
jgi:Tol biopolymer transport system component